MIRREPARNCDALPESGFTLLELLVAMTIMSLVALLMLGGLKFGIGAWERAEATNNDSESIEVIQRLLRQQLSDIYPLWQESGQGSVTFDGDPKHLLFVADPPAQLGPGANRTFMIELAGSGDLVLTWRPSNGTADSKPVQATLLRHVQSIAFSYFGPYPGGRNFQWLDAWQNRTNLPKLIRLKVQFSPGDRRIWPDLTVHPEVSVDVACVFDPISRGCRGRPQ